MGLNQMKYRSSAFSFPIGSQYNEWYLDSPVKPPSSPTLILDFFSIPFFPPSWPPPESLATWVVPLSYLHHSVVCLPPRWPGCNVLSLSFWKRLQVTLSLPPQSPCLQSFLHFQPEWSSPVRPIASPLQLFSLTILALLALLSGPSDMLPPQPGMLASPSSVPPFTWLTCHPSRAIPSFRKTSLVESFSCMFL